MRIERARRASDSLLPYVARAEISTPVRRFSNSDDLTRTVKSMLMLFELMALGDHKYV
jgi:hypothetical protein